MENLKQMLNELEQAAHTVCRLIPEVRAGMERQELVNARRPPIRFDAKNLTATCCGKTIAFGSAVLQFELLKRVWETRRKRLTEERAERLVWKKTAVSSKTMGKMVRAVNTLLILNGFPYVLQMNNGMVYMELAEESILEFELPEKAI